MPRDHMVRGGGEAGYSTRQLEQGVAWIQQWTVAPGGTSGEREGGGMRGGMGVHLPSMMLEARSVAVLRSTM